HDGVERDGDEATALHADQRALTALDHVARGAIAEVARVLHVEGDRVRAAELVADVLGDDRRLELQRGELALDGALHDVAEVDLRDADVAVGVALDAVEAGDVRGVDDLDETFGEDGDAVGTPLRETLDDGAGEGVDDVLHTDA